MLTEAEFKDQKRALLTPSGRRLTTRRNPILVAIVTVVATAAVANFAVASKPTLNIATASVEQSLTQRCLSYGYNCTPGYDAVNTEGTWAWAHYGGQWAATPNGYHNCTLYAAWRLEQNGLGDPGNWGNAVDWKAHLGGNNVPGVGTIAWWGSEVGGGFGHVAYVEQVSGGSVFIRADNFSTSRGYTDSGWIADSAVDAFLHPHDVGPGSAPTGGGQPPTNPPVGSPPSPSSEHIETAGGVLRTWTNPANGGGQRGANIARYQSVQVACRLQGLRVSDGNTWWYEVASSPWNDAYFASADGFFNNGSTSGSLRGTPFVDNAVPTCSPVSSGASPPAAGPSGSAPTPTPGHGETTGGVAHTWTNYTDAGGSQGPSIPSNDTVQVTCKVTGFRVPDGNTWWYQIASSPWNNAYYASADAFYNNGATSGSLIGTPFVDPSIPDCASQQPVSASAPSTQSVGGANSTAPSSGPPTYSETPGGVSHTWTDYANAGGSEGPSIPSNETVQITCKVTGFGVADGDTWWYQIGSSPWNNAYYASADAFYNNGATSGSLIGTPFVDPSIPDSRVSNRCPPLHLAPSP